MNHTDPTTRYRNRSVEITAVQWTGSNAETLTAFAPNRFATATPEDRIDPEDDALVLIEESHWVAIRPGCWVLQYPDHFDVESDADFRTVWEPAAAPAVVSPPTDRAALRDRIAAALIEWTYRGKNPEHGGILETVRANAYSRADAVLAVLGEQADRAAALLDAADRFDRMPEASAPALQKGITWATSELRRLATEAQQQAETEAPVCGHVNPEGGERCGLEQSHDWHRRVVPLEVGETSVSWAPTEAAPVAQQPATEASAAQPVRHAPGTAILCPDCRAKGYAVCMTAEQQPAADGDEETNRG